MSRRRTVLQLEETRESSPYTGSRRREPGSDDDQSADDDDDDPMGDMPTPERLVPPDMPLPMPNGGEKLDIDNKVANFLAEIDALDHGDENSRSPAPTQSYSHEPRDDSPPHFQLQQSPPPGAATPPRSPPRSKPGAYSMFVKGDTEFTRHEHERQLRGSGRSGEKWPEEPRTVWSQLIDEKSNHPYYWNTETNEVVWDMPSEFQQYLLLHKEYEEKVEKGLSEGKLRPEDRPGVTPMPREEPQERPAAESSEHPRSRRDRRHSSSSDSSRDSSSDSDRSSSRGSRKGVKRTEQPSSSTTYNEQKKSSKEREIKASTSNQDSQDLPDSTESEEKEKKEQNSKANSEEMDFDIDDIDKELEMALERKRQELLNLEDKDKKTKDSERVKNKEVHRRKDEKRHDDKRRHDRKRDEHREERKHRDREKERKHGREEKEEKKLSLKERLRMEMEMKLEKERRKKKAIEDMMARELEMTVGSKGRKRHHRDSYEESRKRYKDEESTDPYRRDPYHEDYDDRRLDDYRGYDTYDRYKSQYDRVNPPPRMTPPPPTSEMMASEEERKSKVVDYKHGRSRNYEENGDSDIEESRGGFDERDLEMKKLEALQLAELALSKLEFLEVTKKGLSKLQILLIELETRHQDWQSGGLSTNHFLMKLREANWQLEQYEESAAPLGWICSWDRYGKIFLRELLPRIHMDHFWLKFGMKTGELSFL